MGRKKGGPPQVVQQSANPWGPQASQLEYLYGQARNLYEKPKAEFFPGQTYANFSPQELEAMNLAEARARAGSPDINLSRNYARGILNGDPATLASTLGPKIGELIPGLQSQFNRAGMGASSLARSAEQELVARELSKLKESAADRLEKLGAQDYVDISKLASIGEAKRDMEQAKIDEAMRRHEFEQQEPWRRLAQYQAAIQGAFNTPDSANRTFPIGGSRLSGALGGAGMGAGLGGLFGPAGAGIGGILGGIGGLF